MAAREGTKYDDQGDRWYTHPRNPTANYAGVSAILGSRNKSFLTKAKVSGVARYAAKNRKSLAEMTQAGVIALLKSQDEVLPDWVAKRDAGTAAHQVLDNIFAGDDLAHNVKHVDSTDNYTVANDFTTWVPAWWEEFNASHKIETLYNERTVFSHKHGYAGSFDWVGYVDGKLSIVDFKTNAGGPTDDVPLQNMAYAKADVLVDMKTGVETPLPVIEQSWVLWLRPEGWAFVPLEFEDMEWRVFYGLLLALQWGKGQGQDAIGEPVSGTLQLPTRWGS